MVGTYADGIGWAFAAGARNGGGTAPVLCDGTGEYTGGVGRSGTAPT